MKRRAYSYPYLVWMIIFILVPLGIIGYYALTQTLDDGTVIFSLENLGKAFTPTYLSVLLKSMLMALVATVICLLLGYPVAMILCSKGFKRASLMIILLILPMWMNFLLRTYALAYVLDDGSFFVSFLRTLGFQGSLIYNQTAVIIGLVYNYLPFMILPIYTAMSKLDRHLFEAAEDLGANSFHVFRKVTLPLTVPGIVSGVTMVFMPAVTTFAVSRLLGGSNSMMYGDLIENQFFFMRDWHFGATLSLALMLIILISMMVLRKFDSDKEGGMLW